jgi:hypothetical protein
MFCALSERPPSLLKLWRGWLGETRAERLTVLNILHRVGAGGHNNTKVNPVFRGMVRFARAAEVAPGTNF